MFSRQFNSPNGDSGEKAELIKQLSKSYKPEDLAWINDGTVHVQRTSIHPADIDWDDRHEWAATHDPKEVKDKRKKIKKGDVKPIVTVDRPGRDDLFIMDGHHRAEAYTQLDKQEIPSFVIRTPRSDGPWMTLHDKQVKD